MSNLGGSRAKSAREIFALYVFVVVPFAVTALCKKKIDLILQIKGAFRCGLATGRPLTFRPSDARRAVDNRTPRIGPED